MKKKNEIKENIEEKSLQKIENKHHFRKIFITIKKKWLVSRLYTFVLMVIVTAIIVVINIGVKKADFTAIDCTTSQDYSITEDTKERISKIEKEINIYFVNFDEEDKDYILVKQYGKTNSKIKVERIDSTKNVEFANKYGIQSGNVEIIVECGEKSITIMQSELVSYRTGGYEPLDITEQKVTSAVVNISTEKTPKAYFLTGYTEFDLSTNLASFSEYLENEVLEYETLNILNKKNVPEDCDALIIMTPNRDFEELVADEIIKYINRGGKILWLNGAYTEEKDFKNVNKVLAQFGINKFEKGLIYETDLSKIFGEYTCFAPNILDSSILTDVKQSQGTVFFYATKINIDTDKLEELKVQETDLLQASEKSYFTKNLTGQIKNENDEKGPFVLGTKLEKTVKEAVEATDEKEEEPAVLSTLIIYGNDYFISDYTVQISRGYQTPIFSLFNNADVALNSLAYLTDNYQEIFIRKTYSDAVTDFNPSQMQKNIVMAIIFTVPVIIILIGLIVWIRRKKRQ